MAGFGLKIGEKAKRSKGELVKNYRANAGLGT